MSEGVFFFMLRFNEVLNYILSERIFSYFLAESSEYLLHTKSVVAKCELNLCVCFVRSI